MKLSFKTKQKSKSRKRKLSIFSESSDDKIPGDNESAINVSKKTSRSKVVELLSSAESYAEANEMNAALTLLDQCLRMDDSIGKAFDYKVVN